MEQIKRIICDHTQGLLVFEADRLAHPVFQLKLVASMEDVLQ